MMIQPAHKNLPIGVFDSGVGGLTVLRSLVEQLPHESFIYLGDTARLPYGTKSPDTVIRYSIQVCNQLINQGIKMLVVACNTASTLALQALQQHFPQIPVVGVLEPSARAACQITKNNCVAVIATEATVNAQAYQNLLKKMNPAIHVIAKSCSLFVALAEEGWIEGDIAEAIARRYLSPIFNLEKKPDCLVLGCTHFPMLIKTFRRVLTNDIQLIDSASVVAETVNQTLLRYQMQQTRGLNSAHLRFMVTDSPERFAKIGRQFLSMPLTADQVELLDACVT